jgi:hypothetical protein
MRAARECTGPEVTHDAGGTDACVGEVDALLAGVESGTDCINNP